MAGVMPPTRGCRSTTPSLPQPRSLQDRGAPSAHYVYSIPMPARAQARRSGDPPSDPFPFILQATCSLRCPCEHFAPQQDNRSFRSETVRVFAQQPMRLYAGDGCRKYPCCMPDSATCDASRTAYSQSTDTSSDVTLSIVAIAWSPLRYAMLNVSENEPVWSVVRVRWSGSMGKLFLNPPNSTVYR